MGQSLVGGVIGGIGGAIQGFIRGGPAGALALGAVGFVGGFASSFLAKQATANALSSAMDGQEPKFGGYNVNRRGAALHQQVIYGQTKTGGVVVFDDAHGTNNENLSRIIAYAGHEIHSFEKIYMGRYELTLSGDSVTSAQEIDENGNAVGSATNKFNNYIKIRKVLGNHTASLNGTFSGFSSEWTSSHKLLGIAHLAIIFTYADDVWEEGLPEVTALIKGKKVLDPRTSTTAWSDNPALIVRDFLTNTDYGLGEDSDNIDDTLVSSAANVCEETVTDGDRYTCNGSWTTSQAPVDVIAQLMTSCAGYLWYAQGLWRMKAGDYVAPSITLTEDDLRSPLSVATRHSRRDNFNAVRGTFRGPATNYQFTDYPTVTSSTFLATDNNQESTLDLALPFTDTPEEAQRLANIALEKNRSQITVTGSFGLNAFDLQVGDNVSITNSRFGWSSKLFEVVAWSLSVEDLQLQVNLVLRETTTTTYDEFQDITGFESDNTNLPGALGEVVVAGVNETTAVTGLTAEGGIKQIKVSWTNPINNNYDHTEVYRATTQLGTYTKIADITGESYVDTSLGAAVQRFYKVKAVDASNVDLGGGLVGPASATTKTSNTDDIINGSITKHPSDIQVGSNSLATSFEKIAEVTINVSGNEDVIINWSFVGDEQNFAGDERCDIRVGSDHKATPYLYAGTVVVSNTQTFGGTIIDSNPGSAGNKTYFLQARSSDSANDVDALYSYISAVELKR